MSKYNKFKFKNLLYYAVSFLVVIALLGVFTRTSSSASNTEVKKLKQQLEMQKVNYENQIENQKTSFESQINEQKTNYENQIQDLNNTNNTLSSEVENYYNYEYSLTIDFYVENELYMTGKARNGGTLLVSPTEPTKENYNFKGWSLTSDGNVIDLSTNVFTSDTTLYAIFEEIQEEFTLTGTTWIFNDTIDLVNIAGNTFKINFTSPCLDGKNFNSIYVSNGFDGENYIMDLMYDDYHCASQENSNFNGWQNENAKIINIIDGDDVKHEYLISWLKENATQVISFTINDTTYYAEPGMTWSEWCQSEYALVNDFAAFSIIDNCVQNTYDMYVIANVKSSDIIVCGENYTVTYNGPGPG